LDDAAVELGKNAEHLKHGLAVGRCPPTLTLISTDPHARLVPRSRATTGCGSLLSNNGRANMRHTLVSLVVAASLLSVASSEASAWVCRAVGIGSGGYGRSFSVIDAKLIALRRCENYSPIPVCTILWCRPGG